MHPAPYQDGKAPSLAVLKQTPRYQRLRYAQLALGLASVLLLIQTAVEFFTSDIQFHDALNKKIEMEGPDFARSDGKTFREAFLKKINIYSLSLLSLGVLMMVAAVMFHRFPLFCTTSCLLIYAVFCVAAAYFFAQADKETTLVKELMASPLWKLAIAVCLLTAFRLTFIRERRDALVYRY